MKSLTAGLLFFGCLFAAGTASAHFAIDFPKSRSNELDKSPCGPSSGGRSSTVTVFHPGDTVKLQWDVMVQHTMPGLWRISIDDSGQDFPDPVGADDKSTLPLFMDHVEVTGLGKQELTITIPNIECQNCTLQILQYKIDKPPYTDPSSFYYQCSDIVIDANAAVTPPGGTGGSSAEAGGSSSGGSSAPTSGTSSSSGSGSGGSAGKANGGSSGGCNFGAGRAPASTAVA